MGYTNPFYLFTRGQSLLFVILLFVSGLAWAQSTPTLNVVVDGSRFKLTWQIAQPADGGYVVFADGSRLAETTNKYYLVKGLSLDRHCFKVRARYLKLKTVTDSTVVCKSSATTATNKAPTVEAGANQTIQMPQNYVVVSGVVKDDGLPNGTLKYRWSKVSGTGTVTFSSPYALKTKATFSVAGTYELRLTANDGALASSDTLKVYVRYANSPLPPAPAPAPAPAPQPPPLTDGKLILDEGLESGLLPASFELSRSCVACIVEPSSAISREGRFSLHTKLVRNGIYYTGGSAFRSEVRVKSAADNVPIDGSPDYWVGVSIYVPSSSNSFTESSSVVLQWHDRGEGNSPVVGLRIKDGNFIVAREVGTRSGGVIGPVQTNRWNDFVFRVKFRKDNTGLVHVFKDGKQVININNTVTAPLADPNLPVLKMGRYSAYFKVPENPDPIGTVHETYHDALRIFLGNSGYDLVKPR